eukprot:SAG11_NODE_301_length_11038_cov_2.312826_2_plen_77_part_00
MFTMLVDAEDLAEISKLIAQAEFFGSAVDAERKVLVDKQSKLFDDIRKQLLELAQTGKSPRTKTGPCCPAPAILIY